MPRKVKNLSKLHMLISKSVSSVRRKYEEKVQGGSMRRIDKIFCKGKEKSIDKINRNGILVFKKQ